MGGRGSGRFPSFGSQATLCEHALAIDLASLKRDGYLFAGCAGKITWTSRPYSATIWMETARQSG